VLVVVAAASSADWVRQETAGCDVRLVAVEGWPTFSEAANRGIEGCEAELVGLVNDDLLIEPGWCRSLSRFLNETPGAGAVQGAHSMLDSPQHLDGCGIGWNRFWRPVQLGRGRPVAELAREPVEVFGVSGTAAIYRRKALDGVQSARSAPFDERLGSYYEDVELAGRLRAAGWSAWCCPEAAASHRGSVSARRWPFRRQSWHAGNRLLVTARLLGRKAAPALLLLLMRDLAEIAGELSRGRLPSAFGVLAGWLRALARLGTFARLGAESVPRKEIERFRVRSAIDWPCREQRVG
jgi:GT2 family glycosyltransferase